MKAERIETARFILEPFGERFISDRYIGWLNDPDVVRYSRQREQSHSEESCREYLVALESENALIWAILGRDGVQGHVGNLNAYIDSKEGIADIGILVGERDLWGRGVAREAMAAVVGFLFAQSGLRKITCGTLAVNRGMLGVMRKLGMAEDGVRSRHAMWEGQAVDIVYGAIFREDWPACLGAGRNGGDGD